MRCFFTMPLRMRPRMEISEVKGHLLSMYLPSTASRGTLKPRPGDFQNRRPPLPRVGLRFVTRRLPLPD